MKLKYFFILCSISLVISCSTLQRNSKTSGKTNEQTTVENVRNPSSQPTWAQEELYVSESTLGVSAHVEILKDQSPVQGLILADAKAQEHFKKQLSLKLAAWLVTLNKNPNITVTKLKTFAENLINNDLSGALLIDKRFYNQTESQYQCYSLATLTASELKQKISEKINKDFKDAQDLLIELEASWGQFLTSFPQGT